MSRPKIFVCITFFNENLLANARIEILKDVVDYFLICESKFDHKGIKKNINFKLLNHKYNAESSSCSMQHSVRQSLFLQ